MKRLAALLLLLCLPSCGMVREFAAAARKIVSALAASPECAASPFMQAREGTRTRLIVIAGDRGLAGGYNANVFRLAREYADCEKYPIGKRACDRFGEGYLSSEHFSSADAFALAKKMCADFAAGEYDRLGIISTRYESMLTQTPILTWVLPLTAEDGTTPANIVFEPARIYYVYGVYDILYNIVQKKSILCVWLNARQLVQLI